MFTVYKNQLSEIGILLPILYIPYIVFYDDETQCIYHIPTIYGIYTVFHHSCATYTPKSVSLFSILLLSSLRGELKHVYHMNILTAGFLCWAVNKGIACQEREAPRKAIRVQDCYSFLRF